MQLAPLICDRFRGRGSAMRLRAFSLVIAALVLASSSARAVTITLCDATTATCTASLGPSGTTVTNADGSKTWTLNASQLNPFPGPNSTITGWTSTFSLDPSVTNNVTFTNTSAATQTFIAQILLPISPSFNYSQIGGSSVGITVTDSNTSGSATAATATGIAIYTATINGAVALTLLPDPTSVGCSSSGCTTTTSANFPGGPVAPGVATQIGIALEFTLTPGDTAGLTSVFQITPEPTTALLLTSGLLGLVVAGRRRRS